MAGHCPRASGGMNPSLSISQLKRLKDIMQTMLSEANNANWQELSRLDSERRVLIKYKSAATDKPTTPDASTSASRQQPLNIHQRPTSQSHAESPAPGVRSSSTHSDNSTELKPDSEYLALSTELIAIDKEISRTVQKARQALLEQTRGLRAQVSAKNEYEQANIMKVSSYS